MRQLFPIVVIILFAIGCADDNNTVSSEIGTDDNGGVVYDTDVTGENGMSDDSLDTADEEPADSDMAVDDEPADVDAGEESSDADGMLQETGTYSVMFNGPVNADMSNFQNIAGGAGNANFSHDGEQLSFTDQVKVPLLFNFPIAVLQQGDIMIMWLDTIELAGQQTRQVFGVTLPFDTQPGEYGMQDTQAYVFYGDININIQGGGFEIKCVRSGSPFGDLSVLVNDGNTLELSAAGSLYDPAVLGNQLPYPVCEN